MEESARRKLLEGAGALGVACDGEALERFEAYALLLQRWGGKMNLTSRLSSEEIVIYHFLDSLSMAPFLGTGEGRLVDVGAGAGFPALPLKVVLPGLDVTLVESSHKKASFCREVIRKLALGEARVIEGRGEQLGADRDLKASFRWAVARALAEGGKAARLCLPFLAPGGQLILLKGIMGEEELRSLSDEAGRWGGRLETFPLSVPFLEASRTLAVVTLRST